MYMYMNILLSSFIFFNPNTTTTANLDSVVYPSFFFFLFVLVNAQVFFIDEVFLFVLMIYDERRGKKLNVCVHYSKIRDEDRHKERNG
jgi:hypothetical protein